MSNPDWFAPFFITLIFIELGVSIIMVELIYLNKNVDQIVKWKTERNKDLGRLHDDD